MTVKISWSLCLDVTWEYSGMGFLYPPKPPTPNTTKLALRAIQTSHVSTPLKILPQACNCVSGQDRKKHWVDEVCLYVGGGQGGSSKSLAVFQKFSTSLKIHNRVKSTWVTNNSLINSVRG